MRSGDRTERPKRGCKPLGLGDFRQCVPSTAKETERGVKTWHQPKACLRPGRRGARETGRRLWQKKWREYSAVRRALHYILLAELYTGLGLRPEFAAVEVGHLIAEVGAEAAAAVAARVRVAEPRELAEQPLSAVEVVERAFIRLCA